MHKNVPYKLIYHFYFY